MSRPIWQPWSLRRSTLLAFAVCYAVLLVVTEVLYVISGSRHGLVGATSGRHYLWTYGPTAVLTIFTMLWTRVEYRAKALAPYFQLATGQSSATRSMLVDYISTPLPMTLWHSSRNRHFLVTLAITSGLFLRLLIIVSTGLLSLGQVEVTQVASTIRVLDGVRDHLASTSNLAPQILQGTAAYGLPYPWGTTEHLAFQRFEPADHAKSSASSANVDTFRAWLECEDATLNVYDWHFRSWYGDNDPEVPVAVWQNVTISSPTCTLEAITHDEDLINAPIKPWPPGTFELGEFVQPVQKTQGFATFFSASCRGQTGPDSRRLFWLVAEVDTSPPFDKSPANATLSQGFNATSDIIVLRSTQKFCRPQYAFQEAFVRVNTSTKVDPTVTRNPGAEQRQSQPLDPFDLVVAMQSLSYGIPLVGVNQINEYKNDYIQFAPDRQSQLALPAVSSQQDLDALFQPEIVENAYYGYFRAFAAQIAAQGVFYPLESIVAGEVSYFEDRLFLRIVAVRTMELLFAVLILTSIMMTGLLSRTLTLPFDPCSIAACGKIIRESAGIQSLLRRMGAASLSIIKERLESFTYLSAPYSPGLEWSVVARSATMELMHDEQLSRTSPVDVSKDRWWCPIITRIESRLLLGFIMLCIVALLELTVQISERNEGLASIRTNSNLHYSWTLFPATVMVILGIACRSLDLTTKICTPFIALKDGSEEKCLNLQLLTQSSGLSVFTAVRARYVPASLTTVTVILASFLTIVVSGVYTPKDVSTASIMQIRPNTWFNGTWDFDLSQNLDFDGVVRSSLVLLGNMSWPALTYETLAFPSIEPLGSDTATLYDSSMISAQLPAVRASLTCKYYQGTDVLMAKVVDVPVANVTYVDIEASMPLPRGCQEQSLFSSQLVVNTPIAPQTAFGHADADVVQPPFLVPDPNPSCPLYAFYWGSIEDREIKHIAALSCTEHLEEVQAIVTFDYPLLTVSSESPPMILDSSTRYFSNTTLVTPFTEGFRVWPAIRTQPENEDPEPLDAFFASLIDSRFGIPQEHLTQLKHDQGVIEAIKFQHGVIRAQQFATVLSINANSSSAYGFGRRTFNATAINPSVSRLVTDKVSSRVLEALLAVMAVCVFVHCYVLDVRKVLPHNPCSIAGMMSLLAGSRHLNELAASGGRESNASARSAAERCARTWRLGWFNGSTDDSEKDAKEATFTIDVEVEGKEREVSSLSTEQPARSMSVHQADEQMAPNQEQPETNADEISRFPSSKAKTLTIGNQQIEEDGIHEETEQ